MYLQIGQITSKGRRSIQRPGAAEEGAAISNPFINTPTHCSQVEFSLGLSWVNPTRVSIVRSEVP